MIIALPNEHFCARRPHRKKETTECEEKYRRKKYGQQVLRTAEKRQTEVVAQCRAVWR